MNQARAFASTIDRDRWGTPPDLWERLHAEFRFGLDAAAEAINALLAYWIGPGEDALRTEWGPRIALGHHAVFINPPYSTRAGGLKRWIRRCRQQARRWGIIVVALVPAAVGSAWWTWMHHRASKVRLLSRRLKHRHPETGQLVGGSSFGSAVVIFEPGCRGPAQYSMMEV